MTQAISSLMADMRTLCAITPELSFAADSLADLTPLSVRPSDLPVTQYLASLVDLTTPRTHAVTQALINAAPLLRWQQSYDATQMAQEWLDGYGWVNLASPDGIYVIDGFRLSIGYWAKGLTYPFHSHEPEETYVVLAGHAVFEAEDREPREVGPGDIIHHPSGLPHAMRMDHQPLLAAAIWTGAHPTTPPRLLGAA